MITASYKRGEHPNSRSNLDEGRLQTKHGEKKKVCQVTLTPTARKNLEQLAKQFGKDDKGRTSLSELFEKLGRGQLQVVVAEEDGAHLAVGGGVP